MGLKIESAVYGNGDRCSDVTASVTRIVNSGNDDIVVNPATFTLPDQSPGTQKQFALHYLDANNKNQYAAGVDGDTLDLVPS
jgi:hypothetical protein